MINGTFDVAVDTPKRHKRGTIALKSEGEHIGAIMNVGEVEDAHFQGECQDKEFSFSGSGEFPGLGAIDYKVTGSVWGNSMSATAETTAGKIEIFGTRISAAAGEFKSSHEYMMAASRAEFSENDGMMYSGTWSDGA